MGSPGGGGLNDSGEDEAACVVRRGATHRSRSRETTLHAQHAWKLHVGFDAPVWLESDALVVRPSDGARVLLVPPNVEHTTGAVGWSVVLFVEPGSRGTRFREIGGSTVLEGALGQRLVDASGHFFSSAEPEVAPLVDELAGLAFKPERARVDRRVVAALDAMRTSQPPTIPAMAASLGVSVDRLTHLVSEATGMPPRRHLLWQRLLGVLSAGLARTTLAAAAIDAGFSDHAHMTRTFRRFLGRAPSDFAAPPRVIHPWNASVV